MEYKVIANSITGIRGAKYKKGDIVKDIFFHPGHAKDMEAKGFIDRLVKEPKKTEKQ